MNALSIIIATLTREAHARDYLALLSAYMEDAMGVAAPLPEDKKHAVIAGLVATPSARVYLAYQGARCVGMATCFAAFSTFVARALVNIHDIIVLADARGQGVGRALLRRIASDAREEGACKVTLEVREDNTRAKMLYREEGFGECTPPMHFWTKPL